MATFQRLTTSEIVKSQDRSITVRIEKFQKIGTDRVFFAPEVNGLRISRTMYARKYDAKGLAKRYISHKSN